MAWLMKLIAVAWVILEIADGFQRASSRRSTFQTFRGNTSLRASQGGGEEYTNPVAKAFSAYITPPDMDEISSGERRVDLDSIDWGCRKRRKTNLKRLSSDLSKAITQSEWFVTGNVDPKFFSDDFAFQDPDVKTSGIENYARGVSRVFAPGTRAEVIASEVDEESSIITITWRLEGRVSIGPGLPIKAFLVFSDLTVNSAGLVSFQRDRFSLPGWDIFLSALFPALNGVLTSEPEPPLGR